MKCDVLHNFISPVTGRILCDKDKILVGDSNGIAMPSDTLPAGILPDIAFVFNTATTEIKQSLPNAQFMDDLDPGIIKVIENGLFAIAVPGEDYANEESIEKGKTEAQKSATDAETAAGTSHDNLGFANQALTDANQAAEQAVQDAEDTLADIGTAGELANIADGEAALAVSAGALAEEASIITAGLVGVIEGINIQAGGDGYHLTASEDAASAGIFKIFSDSRVVAAEEYLTPLHLNKLTTEGDVDIKNYRITNLSQSPVEDLDAVNFAFLWDLLHDRVEIIWQ